MKHLLVLICLAALILACGCDRTPPVPLDRIREAQRGDMRIVALVREWEVPGGPGGALAGDGPGPASLEPTEPEPGPAD